jgi:hypothetical protein
MSKENIDLVRRCIAMVEVALRERRVPVEAGLLLDPEVRLDVSRRVFNPRVYEGLDGLGQMLEDIWENWEGFEVRPKSFVDAGDKVVVVVEERAMARNGLEITRESGYLYTLRAEKVVEWIGSMDPDEALAALAADGGRG